MKYYFLIFSLIFSFTVEAKRGAPPKINPLVKDGNIYDFVIDSTECTDKEIVCGMTVSLVSTKKSDKAINWKRELYIKHYDPKEEKDVQEVHPTRLKFTKDNRIQVMDEKGSEYLLEEKNGKMIKPFKTILYKAGI